MLSFVLINNTFFNLVCVLILLYNTSSHSCFRFFLFFQPRRHLFKIPMQRTLPAPYGTSFKMTLSWTQPTTPELTWLRSSANGGFPRLAPSNGGVGRHPELVLHILVQPLHYLLCLIVTQHELWWKGVNWSTYITLRYKQMAKN